MSHLFLSRNSEDGNTPGQDSAPHRALAKQAAASSVIL
jgi:hypothetical protein